MSIIVAEPNKGGAWDVCLVETGLKGTRRRMRVICLAPRWRCDSRLLLDIAQQILEFAGNRPIESLYVVTSDLRFESSGALVRNGSTVSIQTVDPLAVLGRAVPLDWTSFLLIDLRSPGECSLMRRTTSGALECLLKAGLAGTQFEVKIPPGSWIHELASKNGGSHGSQVGGGLLQTSISAASLLGVTKIALRSTLYDSGRCWRSVIRHHEDGGKRPVEIAFLSARELGVAVLGQWRRDGSTSLGTVDLRQEDDVATLSISCQKSISYNVIHPKRSVLDPQEEVLSRVIDGRPVLIVTDNTVERLFGTRIRVYVNQNLTCLGRIVVDGCEQRKTWDQVHRICSGAVRAGLPRDGVIIAFGGGVTLDLSGAAASLFRRGVPYVRVPTTLVGMVDTAVGIKQGFNFSSKKNMLGSFYAPFGVINDSTFLATLPEVEISCGLAEIIKMGIVRDRELMELLEAQAVTLLKSRFQAPADLATQILIRAEQLMMQELQKNLFEDCHARLVDFGHTFSPGLERASGYTMRHGHAVALDMLISAAIAIRRKLCSKQVFDSMVHLYRRAGLPVHSPLMTANVLLASARDASLHRSGQLNLVIPLAFGRAAYLQELQREDLEYSLGMTEEAADESDMSETSSARV